MNFLLISTQFLMTTNSLTTCCESTGRTIADSGVAASGQTPVYCPVYESRLLATARHELSSAAALGVYGSPYTSGQGYGNYVTYGTDASAFYSLVSPSSDPSWHWFMDLQGSEAEAGTPLFSLSFFCVLRVKTLAFKCRICILIFKTTVLRKLKIHSKE